MASFTLAATSELPVGTSVSVYKSYQVEHDQPTATATTTGTVAADGTTAFTGLTDGTPYTAYAVVAGHPVTIDFNTPVAVVITDDSSLGYISVTSSPYSAAGDGSTDDTAAIQAAISAVEADGGGTVFFPAGTYKLTARLTVDASNITLLGVGRTSKLVLATDSDDNALRVNATADNTGATRLANFRLQDLEIDHQGWGQGDLGAAPAGQTEPTAREGAVNVFAVDGVVIENVYVLAPRNYGIWVGGCVEATVDRCRVENIAFGVEGSGIFVGGTPTAVSSDLRIVDNEVRGGGITAILVGQVNARRIVATGNVCNGTTTVKTVADGAITSGSSTLTSATAGFTQQDVGKLVIVAGAASGAQVLGTVIDAYVNATTVTVRDAATATVSGASTTYGLLCDGLNTRPTGVVVGVDISDNVVDTIYNVGVGGDDFNGSSTAKNYHCVFNDNLILNARSLGVIGAGVIKTWAAFSQKSNSIMAAGNNITVEGNVIAANLGNGISVGGFNYDEARTRVVGNVVWSASSSAERGNAIRLLKQVASAIHDVVVADNYCFGNTQGLGLSIIGNVNNVDVHDNQVVQCWTEGIVIDWDGTRTPSEISLAGNRIRNNGQASTSFGRDTYSAGIDIVRGSAVMILGNRVFDDQATKTQTDALAVGGTVTRLTIKDNDFRGNSTGAVNGTLDSLSVYAGNKEVDAAYEGSATLVGGTVTVSTAAITASCDVILSVTTPGGTQGAVFVSARTAGTSFAIKSTSGTDTSTVKWRIR